MFKFLIWAKYHSSLKGKKDNYTEMGTSIGVSDDSSWGTLMYLDMLQ